ncbi:MAG: Prokaryotic finger family 1, partial [Thermoleophilaceae bacterium]|nr:Prokaryotic finger family 1 [Thermoleophilaceae bacterium]
MTTVQQRPAAETETGRACPYCRFPLKEGIAVCECASCHAVHHDDCWGDNGGCAIVGCDGGDGESATTVAPVAISPPPPRRPGPIAISPDPEPSETHPLPKVGSAQRVAVAAPPAGARKRPWLIAAVFMLALAVAGAGAAYYFTTKKSSSTHPRPVAQPRSSGPVAGTANPAPTPSIPPPANPPTPVVSDRTRIERLLKRYYGDVQNGNYDAAWALLSPSYKQWKSSNGGRSGWMTQEQQNERSLDPSGL